MQSQFLIYNKEFAKDHVFGTFFLLFSFPHFLSSVETSQYLFLLIHNLSCSVCLYISARAIPIGETRIYFIFLYGNHSLYF